MSNIARGYGGIYHPPDVEEHDESFIEVFKGDSCFIALIHQLEACP